MAPVCGVDIISKSGLAKLGVGGRRFSASVRLCAWLDGLERVDVCMHRDISTRFNQSP